MKATIVPGAIMLSSVATIEGTLCLVVDCLDYEEYKRLPSALSYSGKVCGKTGWNSDRYQAYYQDRFGLIAYEAKEDGA